MSNITTQTTVPSNEFTLPPSVRPGDADGVVITLKGIFVEDNKLYVAFSDGRNERFCNIDARTLGSFPEFQQFLLANYSLAATHPSQAACSEVARINMWAEALTVAFARGGVA